MAITQVIQYEGDNSTFVWKHPRTNFNDLTQLIVHESQEAILFTDGQALELYGPGRHTLQSQNIPKLGKLLRGTTGKNVFHCEVYFINKATQMSIKWGTDSKVRFLDPALGTPLEIGASGEMNLRVADSRKLLIKLVGTMQGIAWEDRSGNFTKSLQSSFRPLISTGVKTHLAAGIKAQGINVLEIDEHLESLSAELKKQLTPDLEEYGLTIPQFYITTVVLPETDPNFRRLRELHTVTLQKQTAEAEAEIVAAERKVELERQATQTELARAQAERDLIRAQTEAQAARLAGMAEAEVMRAKGYTERDVLQAEVQKAYAEGIGNMNISGGSGGVTGDVVGLGVGLAAAGAISGQLGDMFKGIAPQNAQTNTCSNCGETLPAGAKFCLCCGMPVENAQNVWCPNCGKQVAKGKFCPECGQKLETACPKCGKNLPGGAKFCPDCGEKL